MGQYIGDNSSNTFRAYKERGGIRDFFRKVWKPWKIIGNGGDDNLTGGEKNDQIYGNDGNDIIYGMGGNDYISGGAGTDYLYGGDGNDQISAGEGNDFLYGGNGNDFMGGGAEGDDVLYGEAGDDAMYGVTGNDSLYGGSGNDQLFGESGNDLLDGNGYTVGELDSLTGGSGADTFALGGSGVIYYIGSGRALINDFNRFEGDKIQIWGSTSDYRFVDALDLTGNGIRDTGIYRNSDLIGIVEGRTGLSSTVDFVSAPPVIIT
jgi:Ca2+-binding RTX toxin-like protein